MRRAFTPALSAVTVVTALSVSGCSNDVAQTAPAPQTPVSQSAAPESGTPSPDPGPLPAPEALSDVISRLADPAVPGTAKLALVQDTAPPDAAALDTFASALRDAGFAPVAVRAADLRWSSSRPGDVIATITVTGGDSGPGADAGGEFSFPMEFRRAGNGWQLTRETADMLLAFGTGTARTGTPPR